MKKIYLIDGNSFIYRMFFGLPEFSTKTGEVVNAIFGMAKFFVSQLSRENPDYVIFITDAPGKNFRNDLFAEYKATRDRMPDNLKSQIEGIHNIIFSMGIDIISIPGYEADDVIGTLADRFSGKSEIEVDILSGDKDLYSLVSQNVVVYDTMKRKKFGIEETKEKFGVAPSYIIDYLAIVGDSADNIPGVAGFGPKKAVDLINTFGGVEDIFQIAELIKNGEKKYDDYPKEVQSCFRGKTYDKLLLAREDAFLSKKLATIDLQVDLGDFDLDNYYFSPEKLLTDKTRELFRKYEFYSLLGESEQKKLSTWDDLGLSVKIIGDNEGLKELEEKIANYKEITFDTETTGLDIMKAELVGMSIYLNDENIYYINRLHSGLQVSDARLQDFLERVLNSDMLIIGHNLKYDLEIIELFLAKKSSDISDYKNKQLSEQLGFNF